MDRPPGNIRPEYVNVSVSLPEQPACSLHVGLKSFKRFFFMGTDLKATERHLPRCHMGSDMPSADTGERVQPQPQTAALDLHTSEG